MPDYGVQVGTSRARSHQFKHPPPKEDGPRNPANRAEAKRQAEAAPQVGAEAGSAASGTPPAPQGTKAIAKARVGRAFDSSVSREQRKKARAANFPHVVVCDTVTDYRQIVPLLVEPEDIVLEVGCCSGATTKVLSEWCACAIGEPSSDPSPPILLPVPRVRACCVLSADIQPTFFARR